MGDGVNGKNRAKRHQMTEMRGYWGGQGSTTVQAGDTRGMNEHFEHATKHELELQ